MPTEIALKSKRVSIHVIGEKIFSGEVVHRTEQGDFEVIQRITGRTLLIPYRNITAIELFD